MNCSDWQTRIASEEPGGAAVAEHVSGCSDCRAFAEDLALNTAVLRSMDADPAAYVELRSRVMDAIAPKRRMAWSRAAAVGALAAACVAVVWLTAPLRLPDAGRPEAIVTSIPAPAGIPVARAAAMPKVHSASMRPAHTVKQSHLTAIKLLTDDPNVVIIWLVEDKKGDGT